MVDLKPVIKAKVKQSSQKKQSRYSDLQTKQVGVYGQKLETPCDYRFYAQKMNTLLVQNSFNKDSSTLITAPRKVQAQNRLSKGVSFGKMDTKTAVNDSSSQKALTQDPSLPRGITFVKIKQASMLVNNDQPINSDLSMIQE